MNNSHKTDDTSPSLIRHHRNQLSAANNNRSVCIFHVIPLYATDWPRFLRICLGSSLCTSENVGPPPKYNGDRYVNGEAHKLRRHATCTATPLVSAIFMHT
ncbi:hypothetical protein I315_00163 [Cryptococcus gattii Ru294]|uniref:Uncharacterized protein n=1 Tax=Cryptococcus gattii serotype B (strain WM276 / ATCC MYA-4071) TaxID=367775 RepID=E6R4R1_CRYGW|nr:Hypothetical Protein CGB_D7880C [Cryptococcus gattii WM276]ADV22248.1 Hypothetical Protein CGB_D7880C [Cryptococcus gattii WM276]KIR57004.1 hypothetical protein I315_00163 [Cryptococcus gattii Ru294]KIY33515.1 hypothetical protein I305_03907 [Cryptococcus gattii E566]KJE03408.1 hypothetical protein I311_02708 [Cryptococcus gattii NT-10]